MKDYHDYVLIPRNSNSQVTLQDAKQINDCLENMVNFFFLEQIAQTPANLQISLKDDSTRARLFLIKVYTIL